MNHTVAPDAVVREYADDPVHTNFQHKYTRDYQIVARSGRSFPQNVSTVDFNAGVPDQHIVASSHLRRYLDPHKLSSSVHYCCDALSTHDFDTIAFRGMSGALLGPSIAMRMKKKMLLIRKPHDQDHTTHEVEGDQSAQRYIIVDDFICSGDTFEAVYDAVAKFAPEADCLGLLEVTEIEPHTVRRCVESGEQYPLSTPYGWKPRTISED